MAGVHDYDSNLPDLTLDGFSAVRTRAKAYLATLDRYDPAHLEADDRIDHVLLRSRFKTQLREDGELAPQRHDPSLYPGEAVNGVYALLVHEHAPIEQRVPALEARLAGIPGMLAAGRANLTKSPALWIEIAIEEAEGGADFLRSDIGELAERHPSLRRPLDAAVQAFVDYAGFLGGGYASRNGMSFAIGQELFDFKLKREHLLPYDARSLRAFGQEAVASTLSALEQTAARIDTSKSWAQLVELLRVDHPPEQDLLEEYRRGVDEARAFVAQRDIATMPPDDRLDVVETPPFLRPTVPYAAYQPPGPFEARKRGLYYVTPVNGRLSQAERAEQMLGHNRYAMVLTNVHEAYPGHHLQLVKAAGAKQSAVRKWLENTVFVEGWALYCEQLVLDEGMSGDPRVRLFQLKDQLWRACRVVIDVGLHAGGMTFDHAVSMLVDVAHLERPNAIGEVRRYTQSPTQPMSYLVGKHQILELREREKARLGSKFVLGAFHDRLLSFGSIPVSLIEPVFA